jgi:glycosyltransferase involved in cell wall biosynthesis
MPLVQRIRRGVPRSKAAAVNAKAPRISIGMPAYNAETHIACAIQSLMEQTFTDFELIVSDNASSDGTQNIVETLAAADDRIHYVRQQENIGANRNYTFVAKAARGDYFKWASSNDWCARTFLKKCFDRIESEQDAVVVVPRTRLFEHELSAANDYGNDVAFVDDSPAQRVIDLTTTLRLNNAMNGLIRAATLRRTAMIQPYYGADIVLMGHLAMYGKIVLLDEPLFYRRLEPTSATVLQDSESVRKHHYPTGGFGMLFQNTKHNLGWLRAAMSATMPLRERRKILLHVVRRMYWARNQLVDDLSDAARFLRDQVDNS